MRFILKPYNLPWTTAVCLLLAVLRPAAAASDGFLLPSIPESLPVEIEAMRLEYDATTGMVAAAGLVIINSGGLTIVSEEAAYDKENRAFAADGGVVMREGKRLLLCDSISVEADDLSGVIHNARIFLKRAKIGFPASRLFSLDLEREGRNDFTVRGSRIELMGRGRFFTTGATFTPCDCGAGRPSWKIAAPVAEVEEGRGAYLRWPVFMVLDVPVIALPRLYLPLAGRKSGLLFPEMSYTARDRFIVKEPLFVTLGRSADFTLSLGLLNAAAIESAAANPVSGRRRLKYEIEIRHALGEEDRGIASAAFLREPFEVKGGKRNRWLVSSAQRSAALGPDLFLDLNLVSDGVFQRDYATDIVLREADYLKSSLSLQASGAWWNAFGLAEYFQDLRTTRRSLFSEDVIERQVNVLPLVSLSLLRSFQHVLPLQARLRTSIENFTGFGNPALEPQGQGEEPMPPVSLRSQRLTFEPEVVVPLDLWGAANLQVSALYAHALYLSDDHDRYPGRRGLGLLSADLSTEIWRLFPGAGGEGALFHTVSPKIKYVYIPVAFSTFRGGFSPVFDEFDSAGSANLLLAGVSTDLWPSGGGRADRGLLLLHAGVEQGFYVSSGREADISAEVRASTGFADLNANVSCDRNRRSLRSASTSLSVRDPRGDRLSSGYTYVGEGGSDRLLACWGGAWQAEPGACLPPGFASFKVSAVSVSPALKLTDSLHLAYSLIYSFEPLKVSVGKDRIEFNALQQSASLLYSSSCNCFTMRLGVMVRPDTAGICKGETCLDAFWMLDLRGLGSGGFSMATAQ